MHIEVSCRHGEIDATVRDYVERKCEKLLTYFERITEIDVIIDFEGTIAKGAGAAQNNGADVPERRIRVEIEVDAEHKHDFVAHCDGEAHDEVKAVFDKTLHKMEQQIRRYKDKVQNHRRDTPMGGPAEPLGVSD